MTPKIEIHVDLVVTSSFKTIVWKPNCVHIIQSLVICLCKKCINRFVFILVVVTFTSPNFKEVGKCYLRFFWNMHGKDIGTLRVFVNTKNPLVGPFGRWIDSGEAEIKRVCQLLRIFSFIKIQYVTNTGGFVG